MTHRNRFRFIPPSVLCLFLAAPACVSQARFDDTKSKLDQVTEGRDAEKRNAAELEVQVAELGRTLAALREQLQNSGQALESERTSLAQVRFEADVIEREREEAKRMSEQLLIELERVAQHLRAFSDDKRGLVVELDRARDRLAALASDEKASQARFQAARELTLALAEPLEQKLLRLALVDGNIAIQFPPETAFDRDGTALTASGKDVLEKAAGVLNPFHLNVRVEQPQGPAGRAERAKTVSDALVGFGLSSDRVISPDLEQDGVLARAESTPGQPTEAPTEVGQPVAQASDPHAPSAVDTELELLLRFAASES